MYHTQCTDIHLYRYIYSRTHHKHERRHINQPLLEVTDLMLAYGKADAHYWAEPTLFVYFKHPSVLLSSVSVCGCVYLYCCVQKIAINSWCKPRRHWFIQESIVILSRSFCRKGCSAVSYNEFAVLGMYRCHVSTRVTMIHGPKTEGRIYPLQWLNSSKLLSLLCWIWKLQFHSDLLQGSDVHWNVGFLFPHALYDTA